MALVACLALIGCTGTEPVDDPGVDQQPATAEAQTETEEAQAGFSVEGEVEVVWDELFTLHVPAGMSWRVTGLTSTQATARSGAVIASDDDLSLVMVWQPATGSPDDMLERALASLAGRGVRVEASETEALDVGAAWSARARRVVLASNDGERDGLAVAWRCGDAAASFAIVAYDGAEEDQRHAVRLVVDRFSCA